MKKQLSAILLLVLTNYSFACEPASIDWELFYNNYDLNHNNTIEKDEFIKVKNFYPYEWPTDKKFNGKDKNSSLFQFLDQDHNNKLTDTELFEVYKVLPNPCEGWPW